MAAIQVKHAENKRLQNKTNCRKLRHRKSGEKKFNQSSLFGIIFNVYCTIRGDDLSVNHKATATHTRQQPQTLWHLALTTVDPIEMQLSKLCVCVCV